MAITKIQPNAIPSGTDFNIQLTDGSVVTADIADSGVTTAKIADAAVHTDKIADNNVTHAKLHTDMDLSGKTVTLPTLNTPLTVLGNGNATLQWGDDTAIGALSFDINDNPLIRSYSGKDLFFQTNGGNNRMVIESGGNVGIGTSSPSAKLHVVGNSVIEGTLRIASAGFVSAQTSAGNLSFYAGGTYPGGIVKSYGGQAGGHLEFRTLGTSATGEGPLRMIIKGDGNVGIGTSSPTENLHVYSSSSNADVMLESPTAGSDARLFLRRNGNTSRAYINFQDSSTSASWYAGLLRLTDDRFSIGQADDFGNNTSFTIKSDGAIGIANNTDPYWPKGIDAYHGLDVASNGSTDDFADLIGSRGITQIGRKIFASFYINFPNGESDKAYRFYFGDGSGYCGIYATMKISGTYAHGNSMGYRIYEIVRMANSGTAIYQTRNDDLHSNGSILSHIQSYGWGFHSASNRHYIELRHLQSTGNPYYVDFEFYGHTNRSHVINMQVQKVGY